VLIVGIADTCNSEFHNLLNVYKDTENIPNYQTKDFSSYMRIKNIKLYYHFHQK